ncbi:hypothetical protein B0H19DRAFT_947884, partial [Mycena capillaripes]
RRKILQWLSPLNSLQRQADIFSTLQPGTGEWLLSDTVFKSWKNTVGQVLWCRGIPGAGKTVITSLVIKHLEVLDRDIGVAWVYLNHKETETQSPLNVLGSFLKQLTFRLKSVPAEVHELYGYHDKRETRPHPEELLKAFPTIVAHHSKVYLIVDAFDEYPEYHRRDS